MTDEQALDGAYPDFGDDILSIESDVQDFEDVFMGVERFRLTRKGMIVISTSWVGDGYDKFDSIEWFELSKDELLQLAHAIISEWGDE